MDNGDDDGCDRFYTKCMHSFTYPTKTHLILSRDETVF